MSARPDQDIIAAVDNALCDNCPWFCVVIDADGDETTSCRVEGGGWRGHYCSRHPIRSAAEEALIQRALKRLLDGAP